MRRPFRSFEKVRVPVKAPILAASILALALGGCASKGEIDATGGISAIRTACRATLTKTRYRRLWPEKKGTAQEYIDAYDADPMTHCETCRKKAVWYDREKERFLSDETERLAAQVAEEV